MKSMNILLAVVVCGKNIINLTLRMVVSLCLRICIIYGFLIQTRFFFDEGMRSLTALV